MLMYTHTDLTNTLLLGINDLTNGPIQQTHDANMLNRFNWKSKRENYNRMHMLQHMEAQAANNKWDADADAEVTIFSAKNTWTDADTDPKVTILFLLTIHEQMLLLTQKLEFLFLNTEMKLLRSTS